MSEALSERAAAVLVLLRLLDSWIPPPRVARVYAAPGFAPSSTRYVSCPDCLANGRTMFSCETCGGRGEIADPGPDPYADPPAKVPPDPRRRAAGFGGADRERQHELARHVDRELARLADELEVREGRAAPTTAELRAHEARERLFAAGSFAAVALALDVLGDLLPADARACRRAAAGGAVDAVAVERLAALVPVDVVRVPRGALVDERDARDALWRGRMPAHGIARARRDADIVAAVRAGEAPGRIAARYGLTRRRVQQIAAATPPSASVSGVSLARGGAEIEEVRVRRDAVSDSLGA